MLLLIGVVRARLEPARSFSLHVLDRGVGSRRPFPLHMLDRGVRVRVLTATDSIAHVRSRCASAPFILLCMCTYQFSLFASNIMSAFVYVWEVCFDLIKCVRVVDSLVCVIVWACLFVDRAAVYCYQCAFSCYRIALEPRFCGRSLHNSHTHPSMLVFYFPAKLKCSFLPDVSPLFLPEGTATVANCTHIVFVHVSQTDVVDKASDVLR